MADFYLLGNTTPSQMFGCVIQTETKTIVFDGGTTGMDACHACGVNYMDTANYVPENIDDAEWRAIYDKCCKEEGFFAYFDYSWQWAYQEKFEAGFSIGHSLSQI